MLRQSHDTRSFTAAGGHIWNSLPLRLQNSTPVSSNRQHLSNDGCLEERGEIIRTVLYAVLCAEVVNSHEHTLMSSSYSSLDSVLSHWPISLCLDSFVFMFVFLCVILSYCICVVLL